MSLAKGDLALKVLPSPFMIREFCSSLAARSRSLPSRGWPLARIFTGLSRRFRPGFPSRSLDSSSESLGKGRMGTVSQTGENKTGDRRYEGGGAL